jgi:hypothetical protein
VFPALLMVGLFMPSEVSVYWVGSRDVALQFEVVDAETQRPIGDALVCLTDDRGGQDLSQARTGEDGRVVIVKCFMTAGKNKAGSVRFQDRWRLQVSAAGYVSLSVLLNEYTGKRRDLDDGDPPPIRVQLRKETPPGAAGAGRHR